MHIGSNFEKHARQFKNAVVLSLIYARLWSFVASNSGNRKTGRRIGNMAEICDQVWLALENVHRAPELLFQIHPLHGVCR